MILKIIHVVPWLRNRYFISWGPKWVHQKCDSFLDLLQPTDQVLEVGSGGGLVLQYLRTSGFNATGLDIEDLSYSPSVKPVVYNGKIMPFDDNQFDVALILTVLHHTKKPEEILLEASRVAKQLIIIEDIYNNVVQQHLTYWMDGFVNWKFSPCPRTNKTDQGWKKTFDALGLKLTTTKYKRVLNIFQQATYHLQAGQYIGD